MRSLRAFSKIPLLAAAGGSVFFLLNRYSHFPASHQSVYSVFAAVFAVALFVLVYRVGEAVARKPSAAWMYAFFFAVIYLPFAYTRSADYWPDNHDHLAFKYRLVAYVLHFYQWDFLPYWSTADAFGLGAPTPAYYHKVVYWISASFYMLFPSIKESVLFALVLLGGVGVAGMYRCLRLLELPKWPALLLASAYLFQFYTVTDWFIRGAIAEYGALMLTPWMLWWGLRLVRNGVFSNWLFVILSLTFFAHNVIAYFGLFVLLFAVVMYGFKSRWNRVSLRYVFKRGLFNVLLFLLCVTVYAVPMFVLSAHYDPGKIVWDMSWTFRPIGEYFWDKNYSWNTFEGFTVAFSPVMWMAVAVMTVACVVAYLKKELNADFLKANVHEIALVGGCFCVYFLLQFKFTLGFYHHFPGAQFIQFPWRLLTFIQPLAILILGLLVAYYASDKHRGNVAVWIAGFFLLGIMAAYPVFKNPSANYGWYHKDDIESLKSEGVFGTSGEYMPLVDSMPKGVHIFYMTLAESGPKVITQGNASLRRLQMENPESLTQLYEVSSEDNALVVLPVNYSGLEKVYVKSNRGFERTTISRTPNDPRVRVAVGPGAHLIKVVLPSVFNLF